MTARCWRFSLPLWLLVVVVVVELIVGLVVVTAAAVEEWLLLGLRLLFTLSPTVLNKHRFLDSLGPSTIDVPLSAALPNLRRCEARMDYCGECRSLVDSEQKRSTAIDRCTQRVRQALPTLVAHTAPIRHKRWW